MDIAKFITDLKRERDRLERAIAALEDDSDGSSRTRSVTSASRSNSKSPQGRGITPEGRKRLSEMMKKRWAERRKKGMVKGRMAPASR